MQKLIVIASLCSVMASAGEVHLQGTAPGGTAVSIGGRTFAVSAQGFWSGSIEVDTSQSPDGRHELCLSDSARRLCTSIALGGYDTLELSRLEFPPESAAEEPLAAESGTGTSTQDSAGDAEGIAPEAASAKIVDGGRGTASRTVKVRAKRRPSRAAGQNRVTASEIKRMPGLAEPDVIRAAQALPGVVASSDFSTKLYVRGSSSDQNLVLFDEAILYSPMHFGGIFSTFLADAVGGMDFYKGGFDSRYGGRLSSVLKVDSKRGGDTDTGEARDTWAQGTARVTTLSGSLETDGRKGDFSWVMAGRRTWIDQALDGARAAGITDLKLPYYFYDTQGSLAYGHDGDSVRVSFYKGRDDLNLDPISLDWGNTAVPVTVKLRLSNRWDYAGTAAYSRFLQHWGFSDIMKIKDDIEDYGLRQELNFKAGGGHLLTAGGEFNRYEAVLQQKMPIYNLDIYDRTTAELYAGYLQDRWVINPKHTLSAGIRGSYYRPLDRTDWDPRLTYTWRPDRDWRLDIQGGVYHQYLTSIRWSDQETLNEFWYPASGTIKPSTANQLSAGITRSEWTDLRLRISLEGYYKDLKDLPLYYPNRTQQEIEEQDASGREYRISDEFATQQGYSSGLELTVGRDVGAVSGEASWAVSNAVLRQDDYTNDLGTTSFDAYPADWDQRHTVKARANINWRGDKDNAFWASKKTGKYLRSSLQANFHTGLPYTAFQDVYAMHEPDQGADGANGSGPPAYLPDNQYLRQGGHNGTIRPDYFRLDATVIDWGREGKWRLYWTLLNVTGRDNVFLVNYDTSKNPPEKQETYQIPFLPILIGYEYQF